MSYINKLNDERNQMADLLKGFAVIFMILVHSFEKFLNSAYYDGWINKIVLLLGSIPAAPVFMIVMGYFIWQSKKGFKLIFIRGLKLIVAGLLLNFLLNLNLIIKYIAGKIEVNIFHYLLGVDILFLAGFSTILLSILKYLKHPKTTTLIVFILYLIFIGLKISIDPTYSINDYLLGYLFKITEWSYFPLIPWFIYPLFGFMWAQNKKLLKYFNPSLIWRLFLLLIYFVFIYTTFQYLVNTSNNLNIYYNHDIKFVFYSILFISGYWLLLKQFNYYFNNFWGLKYVRYLGKNVTLIYFIQWIIIGNLSTELYGKLNVFLTSALFLAVIIITSAGAYYLENKIKFIKI